MEDFSGQSGKPAEWTFLTNVADTSEAGLLESLLREEGIPVLRKSSGSGAYTDVYMGRPLTGWDLYVPAAERERAFQLTEKSSAVIPDWMAQGETDPKIKEIDQGFLADIRHAARWLIVVLFVLPAVIGFLWAVITNLKQVIGW